MTKARVSVFITTQFEFSFGELMLLVRDAMMCCYECYRIPNPGQQDLRRTDESDVQLLQGQQTER